MTILHVADWANGGLATYLQTLIACQSQEHRVYLLASRHNSEERIAALDGFISLDPYRRSLQGMWHAFWVTRRSIQTLRPDILHVHSSFAGIFARLAAIRLSPRPKIIYCSHGWSFLMDTGRIKTTMYASVEWLFSLLCDAVVTISKREHSAALNIGIAAEKLYLIEHGIAVAQEQMRPHRFEHTFKKNQYNILFLGRYDYAKGFDWLMDFIVRYPQKHICWHCAGKAVIDDVVDIPNGVVNHGWVSHEEVPQLLLRCDALIVPSRWEGFGLSVIEAMKYAKPVIASTGGALCELVEHHNNGWIFQMENEESLVEILQHLEASTLKIYGEKGHDIFMRHYSSKTMNKKLQQLINDLTEENGIICA